MKTTIADIAKLAGVSKATVSRVVNERPEGVGTETRARVKVVIEQAGFQVSGVARGLATGKSRSVGLIIPDIANPFFPMMVRGIQAALHPRGYSLFLCDSDRDIGKEKEHVRVLLEKHVDGVILSSTQSDCDCQLDLLDARSVPYVLLDRIIEARADGAGVYVDNRMGARMAADYLFAGGCRRLLFLNGPEDLSLSKLRGMGVQDACRGRGADQASIRYLYGDYSVAGGEAALDAALEAAAGIPDFDAVFAGNDMMAIGAMRSLKRHGIRIPEEVEVVGFDDVEGASLVDPPLTTVAQPAFRMGRGSAELLLSLMDGMKPPKPTIVMEPVLVVRGTTRFR